MWAYLVVFSLTTGQLTSRAKGASAIDCDFEDSNLCGYTKQKSHSSVQFLRNSGKSDSRLLSPSAGITSSSQGTWYMYMRCTSGASGQHASLLSSEQQPVFKKCLQFSYNMHGDDVDALQVFMKTALSDYTIWRQHSNHGPYWKTATIAITSFQPFQVVFRAFAESTSCDIGVDDVKLTDCPDAVLSDTDTYEPWTEWKRCDQNCGANYRSRVRFWFSRATKKARDFTYHVRYKTVDQPCPEENRWYFDDLKNGKFSDAYDKAPAVVVSGSMENDGVLAVKTGQESVHIAFPYDSCIFGVLECADGFTVSFWLNVRNTAGGRNIFSPDSKTGLRMTLVDTTTANITMDTNGKQWIVTINTTPDTWTYVTITWSACHGLTYYENGHVEEHIGVSVPRLSDSNPVVVGNKSLIIGKSQSADGTIFSMIELVIWNGMISPADIEAMYRKADQTERFMFLRAVKESVATWKKSYVETPSTDTGPSFTYLRSEFDIENDDYKPASCQEIKLMGISNVDGYYAIFPRAGCGDSMNVWCSGMNGSSPKEYIDLDPMLNYAVSGGLDDPCVVDDTRRGKTWFNKIRVFPYSMTVDVTDDSFATVIENFVEYGHGKACYRATYHPTCTHSGYFNVNLRNTTVRVKPTVNWIAGGWSSGHPIMANFRRSSDFREISANCGAYCGTCKPDGSLFLELASCVQKKPSTCADVKYYRNTSLDGNYTIYPHAAGQQPIHIYCDAMNTSDPKEYVSVLQGEGKNFALINGDTAYDGTCNVKPGAVTTTNLAPFVGHTQYSKIRLDVNNMEVLRWDDRFATTVYRSNVSYGTAASCLSSALCMPRGLFNIDLTGTGLRIKASVAWSRGGSPRHTLHTFHENFYAQVIDANCGAYCGECYPKGALYLDVVVPRATPLTFGEKKLSFIDKSDQEIRERKFDLSRVCNEPVGLEDGRIPDSSFSASSFWSVSSSQSKAIHGRLNDGTGGWRAAGSDLVEPWLQLDLLFVRLVTGIATHGGDLRYLQTYYLSFGFNSDQLTVYVDGSKQRNVFDRNTDEGRSIVKEVLSKPFFARHVRFTILTWEKKAKIAAEIYICPRAVYHHMAMSGDFHFLESSYPGGKNDYGELVTRVMPPVFTCMSFKYHMIGSDTGRLDVYVEEVNKEKQIMWSLAGEQGPPAWKRAAVPLGVDTPFRIIFVGVIGDGYKGDIAVGAVTVEDGKNCTLTPARAIPGSACFPSCVPPAKCDNVTGKCFCPIEELVDHKCDNKLSETVYKDALHYWSFDDPENIIDLKTGVPATALKAGVPVAYESGPVNLALRTKPVKWSGLVFGNIQYSCLRDPSICPAGLTVSAWIKGGDPKNHERFFASNPSQRLGILLRSYLSRSTLSYLVHGSKHKCSLNHLLVSYKTWVFVTTTWVVHQNGIGQLVFYLIDDTGVKKEEKGCSEDQYAFTPNSGEMTTALVKMVSPTGFSIDELAVWNSNLAEDKILAIYDIVTRNLSNISWKIQLQPQEWRRALFDGEDSEHENAFKDLNSKITEMANRYIGNTTVKKIWEEFESDKCIFAGSVRSGVATWRDDGIFRCNDPHFQSKNENFKMKLHVKNGSVDVILNSINLGSITTQGQNTARGGMLGNDCTVKTTQGECCALPFIYGGVKYGSCTTVNNGGILWCSTTSVYQGSWGNCASGPVLPLESPNDPLVKEFIVEASQEKTEEFTFQDCDMTYSGPTGMEGEYRLRGTRNKPTTSHCMAFYNRPLLSGRYKIEARFRHDLGDTITSTGDENSHMGFFFKYENDNNFAIVFVRCKEVYQCFVYKHYGSGQPEVKGRCAGGAPEKRVWHTLTLNVELEKITAYLDGSVLLSLEQTVINPQPFKVGALVWYDVGVSASFKEFRVEEYFVPTASFPNIRSFQLPPIEGIVESHEIATVFGKQLTALGTYTVSGDFQHDIGPFGLCYNVVDDTNFNFVYYRRNRVLFAEVIQSVWNTTWKENLKIQQGLQNSSLLFITRNSRKVPNRVPYNISSTAISSTALNISWHWSPDYDVTGVFKGFKIPYRRLKDPVQSWQEKIVYGQEFANFSWSILNDLEKSTEYYLRVTAFSLAGDGWPSEEILNSTMDDAPDIINLNISLQNVDLQSVLVKWDPLPKYYWNGPEPSYAVKFQHISRGLNITFEIPLGTTHLNCTQLEHFTSYSVSIMALNYLGSSLPTYGGIIKTLDYVPAAYPSNISVTILNTSALAMTWEHIGEDLWQGVPEGYMISYFDEDSGNQRNLTVTSSTEDIIITNLTAYTFYDLTLAGYTRKGLGPRHPMITVRTHEEAPLVPPINIRVRDELSNNTLNSTSTSVSVPTSCSVSLQWDPVPADQVRGVIRGYTVSYEPVEIHFVTRARRSLADFMHVVVENTSLASIQLDGLLFYTNYSAQVQAYTVDNGVPSAQLYFSTPEGVPVEGPRNLQASHGNSKLKLSVKWDSVPVDVRNGILLGYHVYYHESLSSNDIKNITSTKTNVLLTGLETHTSYDIRVCGFTAVGDGVCSAVTALTRANDIAPYTSPWNATTVLTDPLSISLLWETFPDSLWYDYPRGYHITFQRVGLGGIRTSGDDVAIVRVGYKTKNYTWRNLPYYTKYKIEISTLTYRGYGPKVVLYQETCPCPSVMTSTYQVLSPYVTREPDEKLGGILPRLVERMTSSCCTTCSGTVVNFDHDGQGSLSVKATYPDLVKSIDQATTFAFPIMGYPDTDKYNSHFGFIPAVETPGIVVLVKKQSADNLALTVLKSVLGIWPMLLINVLLAVLAGIVMWMLDSSSNEDIFPRTCIRGCAVGFWWAFISMTTVGYGDTTAKSVPARIFAVIWILTGLCLYSILIGDLSSALSATVSVSKTVLYGAKVAVLANSLEESIAIRRNAKVVGGPYYTLREIQEALLSEKVQAAVLDVYAAGLTKELWSHTDLRISQLLDYSAPYGIVISGGNDGMQSCFERYIKNNRVKTMDILLNYTTTLGGMKSEEATEYVQDMIDGESAPFRLTLLILCISYVVLMLLGVLWNYTCKKRRSAWAKKGNAVHPETKPQNSIISDLKTTSVKISCRLKAIKRRHIQQLRKLAAKAN